MAKGDYRLVGGPRQGEAILILPNGTMFVTDMPERIGMAHDEAAMTLEVEMAGRALTADDVYLLAEQRWVARSLLARCLPLVTEPELRREILVALEEENG